MRYIVIIIILFSIGCGSGLSTIDLANRQAVAYAEHGFVCGVLYAIGKGALGKRIDIETGVEEYLEDFRKLLEEVK